MLILFFLAYVRACSPCDPVRYTDYFIDHWGDNTAWFFFQPKPATPCTQMTPETFYEWYRAKGYVMTDREVINLTDFYPVETCNNSSSLLYVGQMLMVSSIWMEQLQDGCCEEFTEVVQADMDDCCADSPLPVWSIIVIIVIPSCVLMALVASKFIYDFLYAGTYVAS